MVNVSINAKLFSIQTPTVENRLPYPRQLLNAAARK